MRAGWQSRPGRLISAAQACRGWNSSSIDNLPRVTVSICSIHPATCLGIPYFGSEKRLCQAACRPTSLDYHQTSLFERLTDLPRGEQTAAALEANLTTLESKLDAMLAALDAAEGAQGNSVVAAAAGDKDPKTEAEKKSS